MCTSCRLRLTPAPDRIINGVLVRSLFLHEGPARVLVHRMKYEAVAGTVDEVAKGMARLLDETPTALVPICRSAGRNWRYGVDQAHAIAASMARVLGVPICQALQAELWRRPRAGAGRGRPTFRLVSAVPPGAVLIDDVVTTGTTLVAAAVTTGCSRALTVTSAPRLGPLPA